MRMEAGRIRSTAALCLGPRKGGGAHVDLFNVEGLVFNGGNATGTAGPITSVVGTLACKELDEFAGVSPGVGSGGLSILELPRARRAPIS